MSAAPTTAPAVLIPFVGPWIATVGPVLGPFSLLMFAAFIGALMSLSRAEVSTRLEGTMHVVISMGVSMVLTGAAVWSVDSYTDIPSDVALMPVAFLLAAGRPFLMELVQKLFGAMGDFLASFLNRKG